MDVFKEVLREFERDKQAAAKKLRDRQFTLYTRLPRVGEIDQEMSSLGISLAQIILSKEETPEKIAQVKREIEALGAEREELLYENGYDDVYFTDVYNCANCEDTGFADGAQCFCLKQRLISRYFEMSNLGKILDRENFDAFNMEYYSDEHDSNFGTSPRKNMERIWDTCLKFEQNFGEDFQNLFFYGDTGLGKTFLSNCIARELLSRGFTVLYTTSAKLFQHVEDARFNREKTNAPALLKFAYEADLLIIDDLGTEFVTSVTVSELFSFINTRLLTKKPTIISTNLSIADLENVYIERITSRVIGEYTALHFFGDDIREIKKYG